jgi:hypothetical protein
MALPPRHAISSARLFLALADECSMEQRDRCEAFMEGCRARLRRARTGSTRLVTAPSSCGAVLVRVVTFG